MRSLICVLSSMFFLLSGQISFGQHSLDSKKSLDSLYAANIKKSRLYDVYIPKNLGDAHRRVAKMAPHDAIAKFKTADNSIEVSKKLHYGIGRWMIHNWNFYEGSRFSHYLKNKGLLHPDDMAQFVLITFHRMLKDEPLQEEEVIKYLATERKKVAEEFYDKKK